MVGLLTKHREADAAVQDDVVTLGPGRPEAVDAARLQRSVGGDLVQQLVCVLEELACNSPLLRIVEDRRVAPLELPGVEEVRPVHVVAEHGDLLLRDTQRR